MRAFTSHQCGPDLVHMWAAFVAALVFYSAPREFFFLFYSAIVLRFSLSSKANISKLQLDLDSVLERTALGGGAAVNSNYLNLLLYFSFKLPMKRKFLRRNFKI